MVALAACAPQTIDGFESGTIEVDGQTLDVALARTTGEQSQGLSGISDLPSGVEGMLFVYEQARDRTFNMRDVQFSLDIWWFDEDGHLIGTSEMEACLEGGCELYPSPGEIMWALETLRDDFEFSDGSRLEFPTVENE